MERVIYADVLIAVNIFITYIFLVCVRVVTKNGTNKYGMLVSSLIGGFSSLIIFYDDLNIVLSIIYKTAVAIVISYTAFLPKNKKVFLKVSVGFLLVSVLFGGFMYLFEIMFSSGHVFYMNGTVYFDISLLFLVSMTLIFYGILIVCDYIFKKKTSEKTMFSVTVVFRNEEVTFGALYDTGNHLTDGLEGRPVNVVLIDKVAPLFSFSEIEFLKFGRITDAVPEELKKYLRLVPCTSVTGESILFSVIPDKIVISDGCMKYETDFSVLAITNKKIGNDEFSCILSSDIFERGKKTNAEKIEK